jgi:type II restriction enzyme
VEIALATAGLEKYKSNSQRARVGTEGWGRDNLYCANCVSDRLVDTPTNTRAIDFTCAVCLARYQLKSQGRPLRGRIAGASYETFRREILEDRTPNLIALHYRPLEWCVENLVLIPHFAFPLSALKKRSALNPEAERHGWVGYYILLDAIPPDARIWMVTNGVPRGVREVRDQYRRIQPLEKLEPKQRGWTLDVLNVVRTLGKTEFRLTDVYAHEKNLAALHPNNRNVQPKIREQLQELRKLGLLEFLGGGRYRLLTSSE